MANDSITDQIVPSAQLLGLTFDLLAGDDIEKFSHVNINDASELISSKLGIPNACSQCTTCGSTNIGDCEGHFGVIKLPTTIYHPYFIYEVVHILNQICPACKSIKKDIKKDMRIKKTISSIRRLLLKMKFEKISMPQTRNLFSHVASAHVKHLKFSGSSKKWEKVENQAGCKHCSRNSEEWYPAIKFKALSRDISGKKCVAITAEINEKLPRKFERMSMSEVLPKNFWNFVPMLPSQHENSDPSQHEDSDSRDPSRITLSPAQAFYLLRELDKEFIEQFVPRRELIFLSCIPVSPNCQRVVETIHSFSDGPRLSHDKSTKAYRGVVDASKKIDEFQRHQLFGSAAASFIASRVHDCLNVSKLHSNKASTEDHSKYYSKQNDHPSSTGLKWIKEVVLSKRSDNTFRMVMIGDPKIQMGEIGLPRDVSRTLYIAEHVNAHNVEKLKSSCRRHLIYKPELKARRKGKLIFIHSSDQLQVGDTLNRPLEDGDVIMVNRNPSVHPHSLLALSVKILPVESAVSINPLSCAPLLGDFDGDCLHGYVSQSVRARVELSELLSLDQQLFNVQDGRSLLSLTHDSLTAAHLLMEGEVSFNKLEMQQLEMLCLRKSQFPAMIKAPFAQMPQWTGRQLFSMMLPLNMNFSLRSSTVEICNGDLVPSPGVSFSSQNFIAGLFSRMFKLYGSKANNYLFSFQEVLCEYLTMRGLSVSLHDIYLASDPYTRNKLINEVSFALEEAKSSCHFNELMLEPEMGILIKAHDETDDSSHTLNISNFARVRRPISQASIAKFKDLFRDLQNVVPYYISSENSLFTMMYAGSKGSLAKLVQQGVCLGLQLSAKPLPFSIPLKLSCPEWNRHKAFDRFLGMQDASSSSEGENSYAVVEASFLDGLSPLECFVHALSCRSNMFSDNAELPGTLTRKIMFYMRDISVAYDGTVRNAYGQQLVQFSYGSPEKRSCEVCDHSHFPVEEDSACDRLGGHPVGSLAACSISEAAYGALDHPVNSLESSPLLNLKRVLECAPSRTSVYRTASLALSNKLKRLNYGFEYGALAVKNHLDRVFFSDVVTSIMIFYLADDAKGTKGMKLGPWVLHFHVNKEVILTKRINIQSIINALARNYNSVREDKKLPRLFMTCQSCVLGSKQNNLDELCISVVATENSEQKEEDKHFPTLLATIRDFVVPVLLQTLIKGFKEFKQVDILWDSKCKPEGQLFLKITMAESCPPRKFWRTLQNACLPVMDIIDWERSRPDGVYDFSDVFGIISSYSYFLGSLKSAVSDIGRNIHLEHLLLVSDSLSVTGEFHGLSAKGIKQQRAHMSISSPFTQACFSNPEKCFIEAGKQGSTDHLYGTVDAVAWGQEAPVGTGGPFKIIYSGKVHSPKKMENIYETLLRQKHDSSSQVPCADKWKGQVGEENSGGSMRTWNNHNCITKREKDVFSSQPASVHIGPWDNVSAMSSSLSRILHQYPVDHQLNEADKSLLMEALLYHPKKDAKIGTGIKDIKIGHSPFHPKSRCFILIRNDGTTEDFSYRKCVIEAAYQISHEFGLMVEKELDPRR